VFGLAVELTPGPRGRLLRFTFSHKYRIAANFCCGCDEDVEAFKVVVARVLLEAVAVSVIVVVEEVGLPLCVAPVLARRREPA
jgi:hypothetical protein